MSIRWLILFQLAWFAPAWGLHVIIDPGHGGVDKGTTKKDFRESAVALDVAKRLAAKLKSQKNIRATLTRTGDRTMGLLDRVRIAEKAGGDVFISIHVNSNPDSRAKGAEFYFQNQLAADEESMYLAHRENVTATPETDTPTLPILKDVQPAVRTILEDMLSADRIVQSSYLSRRLRAHWRGSNKPRSIQQAPFVVVSEVHMPATLVELGFVTNPEDYQALTDSNQLDLMAQSLYEGLLDYKNLVDKGFPKHQNAPL